MSQRGGARWAATGSMVLALSVLSSAADVYDPAADPVVDLEQAIGEAGREGKRILLEIGGDWCSWCHILDQFLLDNADVRQSLHDAFVVVKVNFSDEQPNEEFLSRYPAIRGYPQLFVLDGDGRFLHSQDSGELEQGKSYDRDAMLAFIARWAAEN